MQDLENQLTAQLKGDIGQKECKGIYGSFGHFVNDRSFS